MNSIPEQEEQEVEVEITDSDFSDKNLNDSSDLSDETAEKTQKSLFAANINQIIAADDRIINLRVLKTYFNELNLSKKVRYAYDGQEAIDLVKESFAKGLELRPKGGKGTFKPVNLLLLDF